MLRAGGRLLGDTRRLHNLAWLQTVPRFAPGSFYNVVVFMAAQPSKDGRLGDSPQNFNAGRHPEKKFVQGVTAFHQWPILPEVGELMVNNQQYDSHEGSPP